MVTDVEAAGQCRPLQDRDGAVRVEFVNLTAGVAREVVMVVLAGLFEARRLVGQVHGGCVTSFDQGVQVAVDSGQAEPGVVSSSAFENLLRRQRSRRLFQGLQDGTPL